MMGVLELLSSATFSSSQTQGEIFFLSFSIVLFERDIFFSVFFFFFFFEMLFWN